MDAVADCALLGWWRGRSGTWTLAEWAVARDALTVREALAVAEERAAPLVEEFLGSVDGIYSLYQSESLRKDSASPIEKTDLWFG